MSSVRIGVVTNILTPYRVPLLNALVSRDDCEVVVITAAVTESNRQWDTNWDTGFEHVVLDPLRMRHKNGSLGYWPVGLVRVLRDYEVDLVVAGGGLLALGASLAASRLSIPFVLWSDATVHSDSQHDSAARRAVMRWLVARASAFIASSSQTVDYFEALGACRARVCTSLLGVDDVRFKSALEVSRGLRDKIRAKYGARGVVVLFAGRLVELKGIRELMTAWESGTWDSSHATLLIAGDGPLTPAVLEWSETQENVVVLGHLGENDLIDAYAAADVFCLPSWREPFGVVYVEAVLAGLPVIASDVAGAVGDVLLDGLNALLIQPQESVSLVDALESLLSDDALRCRLSSGSHAMASKLSMAQAVTGFHAACALAFTGGRP